MAAAPSQATWTQPRPAAPAPSSQPPVIVAATPPQTAAPNYWGLIVLLGALCIVIGQAIQLGDAMDALEGKDQASFLLYQIGGWIVGLGLLAAGCFASGSMGARAAYLVAGGFILAQGSSLASLLFGFGGFSDF